MGLIDKTVTTAVKTSKGAANASSTLVKRTSQTAISLAVNYTPDIYDEHQDFAKGASMFAIGNTAMVTRNMVRMERSAHSALVGTHIKQKARKIRKKERAINDTANQLNHYKNLQEQLNKQSRIPGSGISNKGISRTYINEQVRLNRNNFVDLTKKKEKLDMRHKQLLKKQNRLQAKGFKPVQSFRRTINNQTRRVASMLSNKDDFGTKTVGSSLKSLWAGKRFARAAMPIAKAAVSIVTSIISGIMTIITSIPALITMIIAFLPFILVIVIIIAVISPFVSMSFTGRIGTIYGKINELNRIYQVEILPAEVLAITDVLEWTTQSEEQFEQLYSIMLDQKQGNELTFSEMASNVFIKYNPINNYGIEGVYNKEMKTGIHYWSMEGIDISIIIGNPVKRNLLYQEHIDLYPGYKRAGPELKNKMLRKEYQKNLISEAKSKISINQQRYEDYIYEYELGDIELEITEDNKKGLEIVKKALTKLGCTYIWAAGHGDEYKDPKLKEFDCSGLVNWAFYQSGINIGDQTTKTLLKLGKSVDWKDIQAGDLLIFNTTGEGASHVGIYIGDGKMVHAPMPLDKVKITDINIVYWTSKVIDCRRLY